MAIDDFEPHLGRMRAGGRGRGARRFLGRVLAAANLARGGAPTRSCSGFVGSRIGRGAGVGRVLVSRDRFAAFRQRRVIVKARLVTLRGAGLAGATAHLRYVERDGTTRDGGRGRLYDATGDRVDRKAWLEQASGDRHQFRFIVSAEDGADYDDLKPLTRRLMTRMAEDLGTRLDWVAVDHHNTGHPHSHIIVRGKDEHGQDLIIARDYLSHGLRERACELVDLDLGPRSDLAIEQRLRAKVEQTRLTSIDRAMLCEAERTILVSAEARGAFDQAIRTGRLQRLERLGLATRHGASHWRLAPGLADTLRLMGERDDIVRTLQRAYADRDDPPALSDRVIYDPAGADARPLIGRLVARGLADEIRDSHYVIVEATDGRAYYVALGRVAGDEPQPRGAIVRIVPAVAGVRQADRTIAEVAAASRGRYSVDDHLRHDPAATQEFAEAHVRRLEAMRRLARNVEREPDGSWTIAPDHLARAAAYEAARQRDRPVTIETLSVEPLETLIGAEAATWLDHRLVAADAEPLRAAGFGQAVRDAEARRRQWLVAKGFAGERDGEVTYPSGMVAALRRRELLRVAGQLSGELGLAFNEVRVGERVEGRLARTVELVSGRHALIERARDFTLVPWRPVLERQRGRTVSGLVRQSGISWTLGRGRGGPSLS